MTTKVEGFSCQFCGDILQRGDPKNSAHLLQHVPIEDVLPHIHRAVEKRGYDELEAHALTDWAAGVLLATP